MQRLNEIAKFFLADAVENNYTAEETEIAIRLQYEPIVADLIVCQINFLIGAK